MANHMCRNVTSSLNNYKSWSAAVCWATVAPVNNATKMHPAVGFNSYSMVFRVTRDYARSGCDSPEKTSRSGESDESKYDDDDSELPGVPSPSSNADSPNSL